MKRKMIISIIFAICFLVCICLYTQTIGIYSIPKNNEIKTAITSVGVHLQKAQQHLPVSRYIQILGYMDEAQAYIEEEEYISAIEVLAKGAEETGSAALAKKEKDLREHIAIKNKKRYNDGKLKEIEEYEYDKAGNVIQVSYSDAGNCDRYEYDDLGNNIKYMRYNSVGDMKYYYEYEYDENGNKIKDIYYDSNGKIGWEREYDEKGNEIKYIDYNVSEGGCICEWRRYEYDEMGNETKCTWYNSFGRSHKVHESEYDEEGNIVKIIYYNDDNSVFYWEEYEYGYSENGSRKKERSYTSEDIMFSWIEYIYDKEGNLTEYKKGNTENVIATWEKSIITYDETGKTAKYITVHYNGDHILGKKKKEVVHDNEENWYSVSVYEYDVMGNMIKQTYSVDNDVEFVREWKYEYVYVD